MTDTPDLQVIIDALAEAIGDPACPLYLSPLLMAARQALVRARATTPAQTPVTP